MIKSTEANCPYETKFNLKLLNDAFYYGEFQTLTKVDYILTKPSHIPHSASPNIYSWQS